MIQCIEFDFNDRIKHIHSLPQNGIYLVPDIKSKKTLQESLLENQIVLNGNCVQRAQDFYSSLFLFNFPDWKLISSPGIELIFKAWNSQKPFSSFSISSYLQSFLPFLTHPEGVNIFEQWIQEHPSRRKHRDSFRITQKFWSELKNLKRMEESCVKYALTHQEIQTWDFDLIVDLGFSIDPTEIEIFKNIGTQRNVTLLIPPQIKSSVFESPHQMYEIFEIKKTNLKSKKNNSIKTFKFQNIVQEVQFVTHQIRQNLESGVSDSQIALMAPHIEDYWPCLKTYLTQEGIPFTKETPSSYLTFPQIQKWLSSIRLHLGSINVHSLEETYFYKKNKSFSPEKLITQYKNCHKPEDLKNLLFSIDSKNEITTQEFIQIIFKLWEPDNFPGNINSLLSEFFHSLPLDLKTHKEFFVQALESFFSQKDIFQKHHERGIRCFSLNALTSLQASHIYLIGLNHSSCQKIYPHVFNETEVQTIMTDLGFYCSQLESHQYEYEITHLLNLFKGSITLSYAQTQLNGEISQPSRVWYLEYEKQKETPPPSQTVLNSIQKLDSLEKILNHSVCVSSPQEMKQQLCFSPSKSFSFSLENWSLSPSKIKKYADCPFVFFSEEVLKLDSEPEKDIQLDPLNKGRIFHELLKEIVDQKLESSSQIQEKIDTFLKDIESHVMDSEVLDFYKQELSRKAHLFLKHEKETLEKLPKKETLGTEVKFQGYWNLETEEMNLTKGDILIKGRIDRIDKIDDQILIIDYKSSLNRIGIMNSWLKNNDVQMPIYIQARSNKNVCGAVYLSLSDFKYKGFILKASDWNALLSKRSRSLMDKDKVQPILKQMNQKIQKHIKNIQKGDFQPNPSHVKHCDKCKWRQICRAKHL